MPPAASPFAVRCPGGRYFSGKGGCLLPEGDLYSLRLVIQQIGVSPNLSYRVITYGDNQSPRHCDFRNRQTLISVLCSALPDFDVSKLSLNPLGEGLGSMVFVGEMELTGVQLRLLGLD